VPKDPKATNYTTGCVVILLPSQRVDAYSAIPFGGREAAEGWALAHQRVSGRPHVIVELTPPARIVPAAAAAS
jgi:hypothetical protein